MDQSNFNNRFGPLIHFQLKVAYLTTEQREYESKIYGIAMGSSENGESEEFVERLQGKIDEMSDPFLRVFNGGTVGQELVTIKGQLTAVERFLKEEVKQIRDEEDFAVFTKKALNRCAHIFFRLNRLELLDPVEIERRGNVNKRLLNLYLKVVDFGQNWPRVSELEEGELAAQTPQHQSTINDDRFGRTQTPSVQQRVNIFDVVTPDMVSVNDSSSVIENEGAMTRRRVNEQSSESQVIVNHEQTSVDQVLRELRLEVRQQRIQFEQRFEHEHFALLKQVESTKNELMRHREEVELRTNRQNEELKACMERYMFQILANQKSASPPWRSENAENRPRENAMTTDDNIGRVNIGRYSTGLDMRHTLSEEVNNIEQNAQWRQRLQTSGSFIPTENRATRRLTANEFEERAKKLKVISQEIKNHRLYYGGKFSQSFEVYISILGQFMGHMGLDGTEMSKYVYLTLEGKPREWYVSLEKAEKELPLNDFLTLLRKRFVDSRTPASWIAELETQKYEYKKHGHISDWVDAMNLKMMSDGCGWSDSERVRMIVRSFPERLRIPLHSKRINSVRELRAELDELYPIDRNGQATIVHNRFNSYSRNHETAEIGTPGENGEEEDDAHEEGEVCMMGERNFVNKKAYRAERKQPYDSRPFAPQSHSIPKESKRCFRCGDEGHYFKECTAKQLKLACFWCKRPEVVVSTCTTPECIQRREEKAKNAH